MIQINEMIDVVIAQEEIGFTSISDSYGVQQHKVQTRIESSYIKDISSYSTTTGTINVDSGTWAPQTYRLQFRLHPNFESVFKRFLNVPSQLYSLQFQYNDKSYKIYCRVYEQLVVLETTPFQLYEVVFLADTLPLTQSIFTTSDAGEIVGGNYNSGRFNNMIYGSAGTSSTLQVNLNQGDVKPYMLAYLTVSDASNCSLSCNGVTTHFQNVNEGDVITLSNLPNNYFVGLNGQFNSGTIVIDRFDVFDFGLSSSNNTFITQGISEFDFIVYEGVNVL